MTRYASVEDLPERMRAQAREKLAEQSSEVRAARRSKPVPDERPVMDFVEIGRDCLTITLGLRAWGVNDERREQWAKRGKRTRAARDYTQRVLADKALPGFVGRVEIEATSYGVRIDPLSDAPLIKAVVDGLRDLGVIENDSAKFVARYVMNAPVAEGPARLVLTIRPWISE